MFIKAVQYLQKVKSTLHHLDLSLHSYKSAKVNLGQMQNRLNLQRDDIKSLADVEFKVFSQFGDDGIIQYLVSSWISQIRLL